ncbi:MAG: cache domain-containing protein [Acidobacteriota bacterium]
MTAVPKSFVVALLLGTLVVSIGLHLLQAAEIRSTALVDAEAQALEAATAIDRELSEVGALHRKMMQRLESRSWSDGDLEEYLCEVQAEDPKLFGAGLGYRPRRFDPEVELYARYCLERAGEPVAIPIEYDYVEDVDQEWYHDTLRDQTTAWLEPQYGSASEAWQTIVVGPFASPQNPSDSAGVAFLSLSLDEFRELISDLQLGDAGYAFLVSAGGRIIVHPRDSYLGVNLRQLAEETGDGSLLRIAEAAEGQSSGVLSYRDELTDHQSWLFHQSIPTTGWTLAVVLIQEEVTARALGELHRQRPWIVVQAVVSALAVLMLFLGPPGSARQRWISMGAFVVLTGGAVALVALTVHDHAVPLDTVVELTSQDGLERYIDDYQISMTNLGVGEAIQVPTGLFIQSLAFVDSNDVHITGYLWQRYHSGQLQEILPGFVFPEAVDSRVRHAYWRHEGEDEVVGWYFEARLRQEFDYGRYPFDAKRIWVRIWHRDFDRNVLLVPDLDSYRLIHSHSRPGIEEDLVVSGWEVQSSFFSYVRNSYSSDFGVRSYVGKDDFPELYFNVLVQRESGGALIVNFVLLVVIAVILFAMLITVTRQDEQNRWLGFSFLPLLGGVSSLFFVLILSHIQLRSEVPENLSYLEWFYFLLYFAILAISLVAYGVASRSPHWVISYRDNLVSKLLFWPLIGAFSFVVTFWHFSW